MSTPTKREYETAPEEITRLTEENTRLREALRTIAANTQSAQVKFVAEQALAAGKGETR